MLQACDRTEELREFLDVVQGGQRTQLNESNLKQNEIKNEIKIYQQKGE